MKFMSQKRSVDPAALLVIFLSLAGGCYARAQQPPSPPPAKPPQKDTRITPEQTKELFRSINQILSFASDDTKLPIQHEVKRRLISRDEVEKYILEKFRDDKDNKRMQREEIVLKKFGLLDRDFQLQAFSGDPVEGADRWLLRQQNQDREPARLGDPRRAKAGHRT